MNLALLDEVDPWVGETATDNHYVSVSGDDILPDMYIGRFPVKTATEAQIIWRYIGLGLSLLSKRIGFTLPRQQRHASFCITDDLPGGSLCMAEAAGR